MGISANVATPRKRLGEIFVEKGIISALTAERVLEKSKQLNRRFGTILEELELVTGAELAEALASQYGSKVVSSIDKLKIAPQTLKLIPEEVAIQHLVFPLKREGNRLAVAMADPTDLTIGDLLTDPSLQIVPFIATRQDIRAAICYHYLCKIAMRAQQPTIVTASGDHALHIKICEALQGHGYHLLAASDGMEAFKIIISEGPHMVITDLELPKLNGYALKSALNNVPETRNTPVILLTGQPKDEHEELRAFDRGFFDVLSKPLVPLSVQARVKRAFYFYDHQYRVF